MRSAKWLRPWARSMPSRHGPSIAGDEEIDRQCRVVLRELKDSLRRQSERVTSLLRLVNSARNLERIGDHTVNIAEAILFIKG